ncbi:MAG: hypothetical protein GOVbin1709_62 [Prokaryotic dsDNA virus sp.]|nr:MAG: hypothetical protein GOVbin1709_62 [Prokaryotic dsDNA virus sp.]|tara:strand:+ start:11397 stop:11735 length:339 start_codon:yes stop_codon:yes gene_type:complete
MEKHTQWKIKKVGEQLINLLTAKNQDYGDSATQGDPIFGTKSNMEAMTPKQFGLCCRIDDKLHRLQNGGITSKTADSLWDLAGYIILLLISLNFTNYDTTVKKASKPEEGKD